MTYDVTSPQSFASLGHWAEQISLHASENVVRFLVGNKCDLTRVCEICCIFSSYAHVSVKLVIKLMHTFYLF